MNQPLFGPNQQSPYIRQLLAQQLQDQNKPIHNPVQGFAEMGKDMVQAFTAKRGMEQQEEQKQSRSKALAEALTGKVESPMPAGQFGPGAPQEPNQQQIMGRLLGNPDTAEFGAQMMMGNLQNKQSLDNELAMIEAKMPYEVERAEKIAQAKSRYRPEPNAGSTGVLMQQLIDEDNGINTQLDALQAIKGGAGAVGRNMADINYGREANYETQAGKGKADLEFKPQIAEEETTARMQAEGEFNLPKVTSSFKSATDQNNVLLEQIDNVSQQANALTTGAAGAMTKWVPGTPAFDLAANLKPILARASFSELQTMRDNSPTGGALGQVSERELDLLMNAKAALEQAQSPAQFKENLNNFREQIAKSQQRIQEAYQADLERFGGEAMQGVSDPAGQPTQQTGQPQQDDEIQSLIERYAD